MIFVLPGGMCATEPNPPPGLYVLLFLGWLAFFALAIAVVKGLI